MASPVNYEFVDKVPEDCICSICTNILTDPVLIECCGKLFCQECLSKWLQKQTSCPHCRDTELKYIKDRRMKRIIDISEIYCPNRSKGCDKISTASECNTHLETCLFVEVPCTNNCRARMTRKELQNHKANKCPKRKVNCQYCKQEGMYKDIISDLHYFWCPSLPLYCPNKCGHGKIQRKDLSDHRKKCPLEPVKCPFFEAGCKQEMLRKELAAHKASNTETHLELIMITATNTQRQLQTMTHTARATQEKLKQLTLKFDGLAMCVTKQLATIDSNPRNKAAISNIQSALETMITMLEKGKQYCLLLVKCDEVTTRSPSFYIQPGYKMYLAIKRSKHILYLEKGEHDDKLEWPLPDMNIELADMDNKLLHTFTICTRCGRTMNRLEGNETEIGYEEISFISWFANPLLGGSALITVKPHVCLF